jgi:hypothetical protein
VHSINGPNRKSLPFAPKLVALITPTFNFSTLRGFFFSFEEIKCRFLENYKQSGIRCGVFYES